MTISRLPLALLPTPMHRLTRASERLGIDLWIKRDDLTGFALGGNKGRKLEYLIPDALQSGAKVVVTCGAAQSNFIRQLGAACAMVGLECKAVVMDLPYEWEPPSGIRLDPHSGNFPLARLVGVDLIEIPNGTWERLFAETSALVTQLEREGMNPYSIPVGGSSALGAYSFYVAATEVQNSGLEFDWIVTASSSGSTQTGLTYGFRERSTNVLGIAADPEPEFKHDLADLGQRLAKLLEVGALSSEDFAVDLRFTGGGYGVTDPETIGVIKWLAKSEGVFLDPIYSGKAFRGLKQMAETGEISGRVLFWHTGGTPSLAAAERMEFARSPEDW